MRWCQVWKAWNWELGNYQRFFPLALGWSPMDNSSGSALRGICSGDELLNISSLKVSGNVEYATYNRYQPHDFQPVLMISKKEVHYVYMFSGILVFITIEFTWSHRTRCLHYLYSLDFLNICWRVGLWSILGDLHVCLFAKRSGSRRETPSESGDFASLCMPFPHRHKHLQNHPPGNVVPIPFEEG